MKWGLILVLFCVLGCSTEHVRIFIITPPERLDNYDKVEIPDFTYQRGVNIPLATLKEMSDKVAKGLRKERFFKRVSRTNAPNPNNTFVLKGNVIQYHPSNRFTAFWNGLLGVQHAGEGSIAVHIALFDKASGRVIGEANMERRIPWGINYALDKVIKKIVAFCKSNQ